MKYDTGIINAIILSSENDFEPYIGSVGILGEKIVFVSATSSVDLECRVQIDATGKILMPGLVNGHCHGDMTLARGFGDDLSLKEQNDLFAPHNWFHRFISNEDRFFSRQLTYCEALLSGTTTIMENMFWSLGKESIRAAAETGIRAALAEDIRIDFISPKELFSVRQLQKFGDEACRSGAIPVLSGVSEEDYSPSQLRLERKHMKPTGLLETRHMAETVWRVERIQSLYGVSPIRFYHEHFGLHPKLIASHMCYAESEDIDLLSKHNVKIVNTPLSEMKLADGIAPISNYLDAGIVVGLGTDGALWNNTNDLFREMKGIALLHAVNGGVRSLSSKQVLSMATINGARVLGVENQIGTVEEGKDADLILIDANVPHMTPLRIGKHENITSTVVFGATGRDVCDVFVRGKHVVKDHTITTVNVSEIMQRVQLASERVARSLDSCLYQ